VFRHVCFPCPLDPNERSSTAYELSPHTSFFPQGWGQLIPLFFFFYAPLTSLPERLLHPPRHLPEVSWRFFFSSFFYSQKKETGPFFLSLYTPSLSPLPFPTPAGSLCSLPLSKYNFRLFPHPRPSRLPFEHPCFFLFPSFTLFRNDFPTIKEGKLSINPWLLKVTDETHDPLVEFFIFAVPFHGGVRSFRTSFSPSVPLVQADRDRSFPDWLFFL